MRKTPPPYLYDHVLAYLIILQNEGKVFTGPIEDAARELACTYLLPTIDMQIEDLIKDRLDEYIEDLDEEDYA